MVIIAIHAFILPLQMNDTVYKRQNFLLFAVKFHVDSNTYVCTVNKL